MKMRINVHRLILECTLACTVFGCSTTRSNYVLKTPEQLVAQLKIEYPDSFVSSETIAVQDASKIVGEWEHMEVQFLQVKNSQGAKELHKLWTAFTYQFFSDGTWNQLAKDHRGVSSVAQGTWVYKNGILERWLLIDNILQRQNPFIVMWHSDTLIEFRQADIDAYIKKYKIRNSGSIHHRCDARHDKDGCFIIQSSFSTTSGLNVENIFVLTPIICRRVADVMKPPTEMMQNMIVHDEELKAKMEAERRARQQEAERNTAIALAIAQGANAFSAAMSQQQNNSPVVINQPAAQVQPSQTVTPVQKPNTKRWCSRTYKNGGIHGEWDTRFSAGCPACRGTINF